MKTVFSLLLTALFLVVSTSPGIAAPSKKKSCKTLVTASAIAKKKESEKAQAKEIAKQQWIMQVQAMHGNSWANSENARIEDKSCIPYSAYEVVCFFNARPCRWESTLPPPSLKPGLVPRFKPNVD